MNIVDNIKNYLNDKNYIVSLYDNYLYIFQYDFLSEFRSNLIDVTIGNQKYLISGNEISLVKMTPTDLLFKGNFCNVTKESNNE